MSIEAGTATRKDCPANRPVVIRATGATNAVLVVLPSPAASLVQDLVEPDRGRLAT